MGPDWNSRTQARWPIALHPSFKFIGGYLGVQSLLPGATIPFNLASFIYFGSILAKPTVCILIFSNTGYSHRLCTDVSFSAPHLPHEGVSALLILCSMYRRLICPVRNPTNILQCFLSSLLMNCFLFSIQFLILESSLSRSSKSGSVMNTRACFCSSVSTFGTIFEHTFCMFNSCCKFVWRLDFLISVLVAASLSILQWSWSIHSFTCSHKTVFNAVSCKDVQPAQKHPAHFFTFALASTWVPYTNDNSSIISPFELSSLHTIREQCSGVKNIDTYRKILKKKWGILCTNF